MPLTDATCRAAKPRSKLYKLSDGGGLQLWVQPNGSRLWRVAYRVKGLQRLLSLGAYPEVSLVEARSKKEAARKLLRENVDPSRAKQLARKAEDGEITFRAMALEYLAKLEREQRADATKKKAAWVLDLAFRRLGDKSLSEIGPVDVLDAIKPVEMRKRYETAHRMKTTVGAVFRLAIANGKATTDPTQPLKDALTRQKVKPRAAITDAKALGPLLRAIDGYEGNQAITAALRLLPILFTRPGELRAAEWSEFNLPAAIWTIPAERTKMRRHHKVPLPEKALEILAGLKRLGSGSRYLFPSVRTVAKPLSENTLNAALRALGYDKDTVTAHGFRATAATLLNETGLWNADAIERQLAHAEANSIRRAYARGEYWDERVKMMSWWADYLDRLKQECRVVPLTVKSAAIRV
jgi:integrase